MLWGDTAGLTTAVCVGLRSLRVQGGVEGPRARPPAEHLLQKEMEEGGGQCCLPGPAQL